MDEEIENTLSEYGEDYEGAVKELAGKGISESEISNWLYFNVK